MNMARSHAQVNSIGHFSCHDFKNMFHDTRRGSITTLNNGRRYLVSWDTSSNRISVKRDLVNADKWTTFSEIIERWLQLDFTTNAEKLERRLAIQQNNVALASPLSNALIELLQKIDQTDVNIQLANYSSQFAKNQFTKITKPLTKLLKEKRKVLYRQGKSLYAELNENLTSDRCWTKQKRIENSINTLQEHVRQLIHFATEIGNSIESYKSSLSLIDAPKNSPIYVAVFMRLDAVTNRFQQMINYYFAAKQRTRQSELDKFNAMIKNELDIALAIGDNMIPRNFDYDKPPFFNLNSKKDVEEQEQIKFDYQTQIVTFISTLIDPSKTLDEIKYAADRLRGRKDEIVISSRS